MSQYPTIIKQVARALSQLGLENGRTYKSNTVWSGVREVMGLKAKDAEWKRFQGNLKRQLVDIGAIERIPGKYQMKVIDVEAIAFFTRDYKPHSKKRSPGRPAGGSMEETNKQLAAVTEPEVVELTVTPEVVELTVTPEEPKVDTEEIWEVTLKESVIIQMLNLGLVTLSDLLKD